MRPEHRRMGCVPRRGTDRYVHRKEKLLGCQPFVKDTVSTGTGKSGYTGGAWRKPITHLRSCEIRQQQRCRESRRAGGLGHACSVNPPALRFAGTNQQLAKVKIGRLFAAPHPMHESGFWATSPEETLGLCGSLCDPTQSDSGPNSLGLFGLILGQSLGQQVLQIVQGKRFLEEFYRSGSQ